MIHTGRHFLQIPGPTNVPDRVLRAMDRPVIDHRGPEFAILGKEILAGMAAIFATSSPVIIYTSSGTGACEASLANTLSPGDRVLIFETGHFSAIWRQIGERLGLAVTYIPGDWRRGASAAEAEARLRADSSHVFKAVVVVHNETSTGVTSKIAELRRVMNQLGHPALLIVDAISSLASIDYRHDEWRVDVMVCGSQKGLMLPPGIGLNVVSAKALEASKRSRFPRSYFDWASIIAANAQGFFPYTPPTLMMFGLREALALLREEGLENVFARHARLAEATRCAVVAWGLEILATDPRERSNTLTAIVVPEGVDADVIRTTILERFDMSLGVGLGKLKGRVFRIGHLGSFNELMLAATLCGVQMGLRLCDVPIGDGVGAALEFLTAPKSGAAQRAPALV